MTAHDPKDLQAAIEAALRADRAAQKEERDERSAQWGGWLVAFLFVGLPLVICLVFWLDSQDDRLIDCDGVTYTGDLKDHPGCRDTGPVP